MRNQNLLAGLVAISITLFGTGAIAATFEIKATNGSERGWSKSADCGGDCVPAYFCSNDIWMNKAALDRVQAKRYAGEQLIIVKDGAPICAVN